MSKVTFEDLVKFVGLPPKLELPEPPDHSNDVPELGRFFELFKENNFFFLEPPSSSSSFIISRLKVFSKSQINHENIKKQISEMLKATLSENCKEKCQFLLKAKFDSSRKNNMIRIHDNIHTGLEKELEKDAEILSGVLNLVISKLDEEYVVNVLHRVCDYEVKLMEYLEQMTIYVISMGHDEGRLVDPDTKAKFISFLGENQ